MKSSISKLSHLDHVDMLCFNKNTCSKGSTVVQRREYRGFQCICTYFIYRKNIVFMYDVSFWIGCDVNITLEFDRFGRLINKKPKYSISVSHVVLTVQSSTALESNYKNPGEPPLSFVICWRVSSIDCLSFHLTTAQTSNSYNSVANDVSAPVRNPVVLSSKWDQWPWK